MENCDLYNPTDPYRTVNRPEAILEFFTAVTGEESYSEAIPDVLDALERKKQKLTIGEVMDIVNRIYEEKHK